MSDEKFQGTLVAVHWQECTCIPEGALDSDGNESSENSMRSGVRRTRFRSHENDIRSRLLQIEWNGDEHLARRSPFRAPLEGDLKATALHSFRVVPKSGLKYPARTVVLNPNQWFVLSRTAAVAGASTIIWVVPSRCQDADVRLKREPMIEFVRFWECGRHAIRNGMIPIDDLDPIRVIRRMSRALTPRAAY